MSFFFNNHDHWPWPWPWPPRELALALALASKWSGLGLGLEHAVLEPIPVRMTATIEQFGDEWNQHIRIVFEEMRWKWVDGALLGRKLADGVNDVINDERAER